MRKIVMVLVFVLGMVLGIRINTYAVDIKVYTEQWSGAEYDFHQKYFSSGTFVESSGSYDLASNFFGFELVARRFYFCAENSLGGEVKYSNVDQDLDINDFKFGCRVVRNDVCTLDIFSGFLMVDGVRSYDSGDGYVDTDCFFSSLTLGGNLNLSLGDRVRLQGCLEVPLAGYVYAYNMKGSLLLTPNFGLTAGYRGYKINDEEDVYYSDEYGNSNHYKNSSTSKLRGLTMGIELDF